MKKFLAGLVVLFVMLVSMPIAAEAQKCRTKRYKKSYVGKRYNQNYNRNYNRNYNSNYAVRSYNYRRPSFYQRHRNLINIGIGTGAGALVGGLIGGKRGALWGALAGAGSGALYTYKIRPKRKIYRR
jgi:hypothetical protein